MLVVVLHPVVSTWSRAGKIQFLACRSNASHRPGVAKLHGKHSLARSLEIRLIVAQKPQGGRKKSSVVPLNITVRLGCTTAEPG